MTLETAFIFAMSLALLWIKPGPGQALIITRTLNAGFWAGFYVVLGITSGVAIFFLIAVLGLSAVTQFFDKAGFIFKLIGAVYLIHIGISGLKNIDSGLWKKRSDQFKNRKFLENFPIGLFLTLGNPFVIFYFLGFLPSLLPLESMQVSDILICLSLVVTIGIIVDTLIVLLFSQAKEALSDTKFVTRVNIVISAGFILLGLFLFYSAFFMSNFTFDIL